MNRQEMIELAAKAVGLEGVYSTQYQWFDTTKNERCTGYFDPLRVMDHAMMIAGRLSMDVRVRQDRVYAGSYGKTNVVAKFKDHDGDYEQSLMFAITKFAATKQRQKDRGW